jgi:hypothetical protein
VACCGERIPWAGHLLVELDQLAKFVERELEHRDQSLQPGPEFLVGT